MNERGGNPGDVDQSPKPNYGVPEDQMDALLDIARNLQSYIETVMELSECVRKQGLELIALRERVAKLEGLTGQKPLIVT